ncbi:MAG: hypothetical protein GX905_04615 [Bacteroidales bacterium]|nr:hypothetical protein [Bacteroidales bacterium]
MDSRAEFFENKLLPDRWGFSPRPNTGLTQTDRALLPDLLNSSKERVVKDAVESREVIVV